METWAEAAGRTVALQVGLSGLSGNLLPAPRAAERVGVTEGSVRAAGTWHHGSAWGLPRGRCCREAGAEGEDSSQVCQGRLTTRSSPFAGKCPVHVRKSSSLNIT